MQNTNLDDVLLGRRVKNARKEKRLTQEELAGLCNCTPTHICNIENGKIGIAAESSVGESDIRSSILDLLRPLGITERYFGVRQLIQAVEMVMENPDTIHALQKEVYDVIALQH